MFQRTLGFLQVLIAGQSKPATFTLRAQLTTSQVSIEPPQLEFGPCMMGEHTGAVMHIRNHSRLLQKLGALAGLPAHVQ